MSISLSGSDSLLSKKRLESDVIDVVEWKSKEPLIFGILTFLMSLGVGAIFVFYFHTIQDDAFGRVMDAYYVIFHQFHLAAIGFVWNPLPSLLELPLLAFSSLWRPLVTEAFAGNIVSAMTAGVAAYYFTKILHHFGVSRVHRTIWLLIYVLNPMILLYEANGMSDCMMVATMLGALYGALRFAETKSTKYIILSSVWMAVCFLIRYEAVPFAFFLGLALIVGLLRNKVKFSKVTGLIIVLAFPITYAGILWILVNWIIMGNPFYFANSSYSNSAQMATGIYTTPITIMAKHHLLSALKVVAYFGELFPPAIPALLVTIILAIRRKFDVQALVLIGATVAVPLLQLYLLYKGKSAAWDRYFITYIPMGFVLIAYLYSLLPQRIKSWTGVLVIFIFLMGDYQTWQALQTPGLGHGNRHLLKVLENRGIVTGTEAIKANVVTNTTLTLARKEATYINDHSSMVVLVDTFDAYGVVPWIKNHNQLVITNDSNFRSILKNPRGRVTDILDPPPSGLGGLTLINRQYPGMYSGKVPWVRLVKVFGGSDHLYQVLSNAP